MTRSVPDCELAPYSVPCGPRSASMRSMSMKRGSGCARSCVIGCSSRYSAEEDTAPNWMPEVATPRNTMVVPPGSRCASDRPGMYFATSSICCRPRIAIVVRVEGADRFGDVLEAFRALGRGDDDLAEADDLGSGFLLLRRGVAAGHGEDGRDGGRERLRAGPRGRAIRVGHCLPSADVLILATGRRPGNPPPLARRMVSTYQSMKSWVNVSMTADSGPGA